MSAQKQKFEAGELIFREGDHADTLFVIQRGSVSLRKRRGASQVELGRVKQGEVIGEMSFFDKKDRSASAQALVATEVAVIPYEALEKIYVTVPEYFKSIITTMADRLRQADQKIMRLEDKTIEDAEGVEKDDSDDLEALVAVSHTVEDPSSSGENSGES